MRAVLVIEEDPLIRELMREHLEREGYVTCALATVRVALEAAQWTPFGLVLLDFASAALCSSAQLDALRGLGAPVVMMRTAPTGMVMGSEGEIEQVVWSPFDLTTLTVAVRRFLPPSEGPRLRESPGPVVSSSGTFRATRALVTRETGEGGIPTLPAPPDDGEATADGPVSLAALGALVLEATNRRK